MPKPITSRNLHAHPTPTSPSYARSAFSTPSRLVSHEMQPSEIAVDLPDSIPARRNLFTALWAGKLKGLSGEELAAYASDVRFVRRRGESIVGMIADDLRQGGLSLSRNDVQHALSRFHRIALHQTSATD
ncbi:ATPase inhibitor subunit zeta [Microvirga massiliensis]|uniref:ATPase inhibitor subunit zeta n=1 Tax=Microvirga massiliensis TaxID=1033741 RepID=UPI0006614B1B|nr:ATPase inhibitor subunit zeta [Microvirga massiliensis]